MTTKTAIAVLLFLSPAALQEEKPTPQIELKGAIMFEGISFKQGQSTKYTGDTYLLKLSVTDGKGGAFQPTPALNFVVYNGQEPYKKVQRLVTKESWKTDAAKLSPQNVADNTIACDKTTGELLVAIVRAEAGFDLKFDLTLEVRGHGTWIWKGMDSKTEYKAAPRGPDKPEKK